MSRSSVEVSVATRELLKEKKKEFGVHSIDAVIQHLCLSSKDRVEEVPSSGSDGEDVGEPAKKRRIDVRDALYSLEILTERRGMLEYYTGFDRPAVDLVTKRFREVSWRTPIFSFLSLHWNSKHLTRTHASLSRFPSRSLDLRLQIDDRVMRAFESWIWMIALPCFLLA